MSVYVDEDDISLEISYTVSKQGSTSLREFIEDGGDLDSYIENNESEFESDGYSIDVEASYKVHGVVDEQTYSALSSKFKDKTISLELEVEKLELEVEKLREGINEYLYITDAKPHNYVIENRNKLRELLE